ncbi:hypothetical protein [Pseudomonas sp. JV551A1]|uniref:hypothetical protein n=1 Tax=Pseudomonas sp. JV551A1 TaxID=2078787 RepID=UPI0015B0C692|nr:hypothetical protein [Pseudomonas sp. JV551A1]
MPANTGEAGAIHRVACFAGTPAPTEVPNGLEHSQDPDERPNAAQRIKQTLHMPWPPCWRANLPASNRYFDAFENCVDVFGEVARLMALRNQIPAWFSGHVEGAGKQNSSPTRPITEFVHTGAER